VPPTTSKEVLAMATPTTGKTTKSNNNNTKEYFNHSQQFLIRQQRARETYLTPLSPRSQFQYLGFNGEFPQQKEQQQQQQQQCLQETI